MLVIAVDTVTGANGLVGFPKGIAIYLRDALLETVARYVIMK
jgi:hypothetical protein